MTEATANPGAKAHHYTAFVVWDGNHDGKGTSSYGAYERDHRIMIDSKATIEASADPAFRGDPSRINAEDLLLSSIASCHLLAYLALCSRNNICVLEYECDATAVMVTTGHSGRFTEATLRPRVTIAEGDDADLALQLHDIAHEQCFIANSCNFPIRREPTIKHA